MQVVNNDRYYAARRNRIRSGPSGGSRGHKSKRERIKRSSSAHGASCTLTGVCFVRLEGCLRPVMGTLLSSQLTSPCSDVQANESGRPSTEKSRILDSVSETSVGTEMHPMPRRLFGLLRVRGARCGCSIRSCDLPPPAGSGLLDGGPHANNAAPGPDVASWDGIESAATGSSAGSERRELSQVAREEEVRGELTGRSREVELDHEVSTGLLEDVQTRIHMTLEWICWMVRRWAAGVSSLLGCR
eukprot:768310-Hanusia_phi.AAC.4